MKPSTMISRRKLLTKLGLVFNGIVGVILAAPVLRDPSLPWLADGSRAMSIGFPWAHWRSFQKARPGWRYIGIQTSIHGMARQPIFLAG